MNRAIAAAVLAVCAGWAAPGQAPPKFAAADVHASPQGSGRSVRTGVVRAGRYEVKNATMVELVGIAYGLTPDKVVGGPNWLELDRFDVIAAPPAGASPDAQRAMLRALLEERFKLVVHKDTRPVPAWALTAGKKPRIAPSAGSGDKGCRTQSEPSGGAPGGSLAVSNPGGNMTAVTLGPGLTVGYSCRGVTMADFAAGLRTMLGTNLGPDPIRDETGLKGTWDFDIRYSIQGGPEVPERISLADAVEGQLGLKLEEKPVPAPVLVVDSVNRTPTPNPPGVAGVLYRDPAPTRFAAASVKPTGPGSSALRYQVQPGGKFVAEGMPLRSLVNLAFDTNDYEKLVGVPQFAETQRYDIEASTTAGAPLDGETLPPVLRALLADRFNLKYHTEERPVTGYSLLAAKPKLKPADPASRTFCKFANPPAGASPDLRVLTCQNATLAEFAQRLQGEAPELNWPVLDATGIEGRWDFTLTFNWSAGLAAMPGAGGDSLFAAVEKQLGLRLEKQTRNLPVTVIDRLEKPVGN